MEQIKIDTHKIVLENNNNTPTLEDIKRDLNSSVSVCAIKVEKENTQRLLKILKE